MKIEYIDRQGKHEFELDFLNSTENFKEEIEKILSSIGRDEQSLSKLKGTQYEKRYINDHAELELLMYLCEIIKNIKSENEELKKSTVDVVTDDQEDLIKMVERENDELGRQLSLCSEDIKDLKNEIETLKNKNEVLTHENGTIIDANKKIETDYELLNNKYNSLEEELKNINSENNKYKNEIIEYKEKIKNTQLETDKKIKEYTNKIAEIHNLIEEKNKQINTLETENKNIKEKHNIIMKQTINKVNEGADQMDINIDKLINGLSTIKGSVKQKMRIGEEMETKWFEI